MTTIRPAADADMAAVADLWHEGWHDGHAGHVPDGLTAARTLTAFHERTPPRVADTAVAVSDDGSLLGFVMVVDDEVEQVFVARSARGSGVAEDLLEDAEACRPVDAATAIGNVAVAVGCAGSLAIRLAATTTSSADGRSPGSRAVISVRREPHPLPTPAGTTGSCVSRARAAS